MQATGPEMIGAAASPGAVGLVAARGRQYCALPPRLPLPLPPPFLPFDFFPPEGREGQLEAPWLFCKQMEHWWAPLVQSLELELHVPEL